MLKKKVKILLMFIKHILRPAYIFFKDIAGFFSCGFSSFSISRFTDSKFFKMIVRDSLSLENKAISGISFQTKPKLKAQLKPQTSTGNCGDIAYESIIMNFDKLGFSGNTHQATFLKNQHYR